MQSANLKRNIKKKHSSTWGFEPLGVARRYKVPAVKYTMAEHKALGMFGKVDLFGGIDKLEADFKWPILP
jgi:phage tail tube protein FII